MPYSKTTVLIIALTVIVLSQWALSSTGEFEFQTAYRISLHRDSSATWVIELSTALVSSEDLGTFEEFINSADKEAMLSDFKSTIDDIINRAASLTGRVMKAEGFDLKIYTSGILKQRGIIEYKFKWVNFTSRTSDMIEIGDVFEGGFYLFSDETLEIDYSELIGDYFLEAMNPQPFSKDDSKVTWMGKMDFSDREPKLIFRSRIINAEYFSSSNSSVEKGSSLSISGRINPPTSGLVIQVIYAYPNGSEIIREVSTDTNGSFYNSLKANVVGEWRVSLRLPQDSPYRFNHSLQPIQFSVYEKKEETSQTKSDSSLMLIAIFMTLALTMLLAVSLIYRSRKRTLMHPADVYMLSDEDLVIKILKDAGGKLTQTQIKDATGFSKSKTSMVLSELQRKGSVKKTKRGRECIVELT